MYTLEINHLDVGQGDCCVIYIKEVDDGYNEVRRLTIVIDCGSTQNNFQGNSARLRLENFLLENSNTNAPLSIDYCIVTHYDGDHLNGIEQFVQGGVRYQNYFDILQNTRFYDRGDPGEWGNRPNDRPQYTVNQNYQGYVDSLGEISQTSNLRRLTEKVEANNRTGDRTLKTFNRNYTNGSSSGHHGNHHQFTRAGTLLGTDLLHDTTWLNHGEISLTCLAVNSLALDQNGSVINNPGITEGENAQSVGLLLKFGNFTYWLGGELDSVQEERCMPAILARCPDGRLSGAKTGHHGSRHSTSVNWLAGVRPRIVCISCGEQNTHGHPHVEVMDNLTNSNDVEKVYLTGYGGYLDDKRNPFYYTPFERTSKFRFCGSDLDNKDGDIRITVNSWENDHPGHTAVFYVQGFQQNYAFAYEEISENPMDITNLLNTGFDDYIHPRSLFNQQGNLINGIHDIDPNTGNVNCYIMIGNQPTRVGTYTRSGDSHQDDF